MRNTFGSDFYTILCWLAAVCLRCVASGTDSIGQAARAPPPLLLQVAGHLSWTAKKKVV